MAISGSSVIEGLFGRQSEQAIIDALIANAGQGGGGLLCSGEPGIGKSSLLEYGGRIATQHGYLVLAANGVVTESRLAYAGLHQLLRPLLSELESLPAPQRNALATAFGAIESASPDLFLIALASLNLLVESASKIPVALLIDDVQWLDAASSDVLAFISRRLSSDSIVLLATLREGYDSPFDHHTTTIRVKPLDHSPAHALTQAIAPNLPQREREEILREAAGNPLALIELSLSFPEELGQAPWPRVTERLEQTFAFRTDDLPISTQALLLVAALDDADEVEEILAAAASLPGPQISNEAIEPAVKARLVEVQNGILRFRHPLVRSAVAQRASARQKRDVHRALAEAAANDPDRRAWHLGAAALDADEEVASELQAVAARARSRGAVSIAIAALERAADLSVEAQKKSERLLSAAELAVDGAKPEDATRLLSLIDAELASAESARAHVVKARLEGGRRVEGWQVRELIAIAEAQTPSLALRVLGTAALRLWALDIEDEIRTDVADAALRIPGDPDDIRVLSILALADKLRDGFRVMAGLANIRPDAGDPSRMYLAGFAASGLWAYDLSLPFLEAAVEGLRAQGKLDFLARALGTIALSAMHMAREPLAIAAAEEAGRLSDETQQPQWTVFAKLVQAIIEAERGNRERVQALTQEAESQLPIVGTIWMSALVNFARGRGAVAHQEYREGLDQLEPISDPSSPVFSPTVAAWSLSDLVEAAVQTGQIDKAHLYLARLEFLAARIPSSFLQALLGYARPMIASDVDAEALFQTAISKDLANWPCYRGRMLLWYGRWLRRQRRIVESRVPLRAARELFDSLGFPALSTLARQELRATGEATVEAAITEAWRLLTPQELQIAQLAAEGLSNREIGAKLFLSPRTVASHLYHIFPKLGISSRSQLANTFGA